MARFDLIYTEHGARLEPHFCREWDGDPGCYGTNEEHGMSIEDAKKALISYYEGRIKLLKEASDDDIQNLF